MIKSRLTLVGAGPGDVDLITYKGIKALESADVILYDALVNKEMLDFAGPNALKIFVGKRGGRTSLHQDKINQLIVSYALIFGHVVRLKGGDPFIFGRGYEEIAFAEKNGISTDVVPGISSATGLSALNKISLTQRGVADGFWVLTASKVGNEFNEEIALAAQSNSTVVILMGVNKLQKIVDVYASYSRSTLPVTIIQNGSLHNQKIVNGTIANIVRLAKVQELEAPAIIVVGKVLSQNGVQDVVQQTLSNLN